MKQDGQGRGCEQRRRLIRRFVDRVIDWCWRREQNYETMYHHNTMDREEASAKKSGASVERVNGGAIFHPLYF